MHSSTLWTCSHCGKVLMRKNIYSHLRVVHYYTTEQIDEIKASVRREAPVKKEFVSCPLCEERFDNHERFAMHCQEEHAEDGSRCEDRKDLHKYSHEYIIRRLRKDYPAKTSRLHFVTKGDLWRIANRFGLRPGYRHKDDMLSLEQRAKEKNPDDGIRLFEMPVNPTGEGFRLIIITPQQVEWLQKFSHRGISVDDTHNATRYNLKLATVMVLNERDAGVPAGRTPTWASFSIPNAIMDTTMVSERWHLRLKTEFLHRNANTRADCLVDLLITAVEDLSRSDEIKARRRLVVASYRVQQTAICHRQAKKECDLNRLRIRPLGSEKWEVYSVKTTELLQVERSNDCECSEQNVHCTLCSICPYAWSCSCTDNRAGISCLHRHAVMLHSNPPNRRTIETSAQPTPEEAEISEPVEAAAPPLETEVSAAQQRREERSQLRNFIHMKISVIETNVNALVNTDTVEAREQLEQIHDMIDKASQIGATSLTGIAVRPELAKPGGKPKQPKVELYTVRNFNI
ncbi:zinc finger, C2H2 type [Cooperia oncophora]